MEFQRVLLMALLTGAIAWGQDETGNLPEGYREVGSDKAAAAAELCRAAADTGLFSGAVLVADKGRVIYREAFGLANREWGIANTVDTKFRLASVSKQFCSLVVLQLVEEGRVSLDDRITDHLPYYRRDTGDRITIHHLLAHQSGITDYTASYDYQGTVSRLAFDPDEFIEAHCSSDLQYEPGTIYAYCNAGYSILGRIIEKVTHRSFEQNVEERIFGPLGMKNSGYDRNRYVLEKRASGYTRGSFGYSRAEYMDMDSSPGAAGSLYATVEDMFLWDRALRTDKLLSQDYRQRMFTPNRDVPEVKAAGGRAQSRYGYGWQIYTQSHPVTKRRTQVINHGGAIHGFRAMENRLVEEDAFIMVLCNQGDPVGGTEVWNAVVHLSNELIHVVTGQPYRMPAKPRVSQDQFLYDKVQQEGVESAVEWFKEKGKKAAWGGATMTLAEHLIDEGQIDAGLRFMELEIELNPGKVWLLRRTAEACLANGRPEAALAWAKRGMELKPDDETLQRLVADAERELRARD